MIQAHHVAGRPRSLGGWNRPTGPSPHPPLSVSTAAVLARASAGGLPQEWWSLVEDQASDGDCAGQTVAEMRQSLALRAGHGNVRYSKKYPYWKARKFDGSDTTQDTGTYVSSVCAVAADPGLCLYEKWPDERSIAEQPDSSADTDAPNHQALLAFSLPNHETIKASLDAGDGAGFAVGFGFDCPKQIMSAECASTGLVEFPKDDSGWLLNDDGSIAGHAVDILTWDDDMKAGSDVGAYFCQNHWGNWALQGRFWLPYRFFDTGHATDAHCIRLSVGE